MSSGTGGRCAVRSARAGACARRSSGAARGGGGCVQGASNAGLRSMRWPAGAAGAPLAMRPRPASALPYGPLAPVARLAPWRA